MAHTLSGYDGACSEIHGHSYKMQVTVVGTPNADPESPKYGMVIDFGEMKRIVGGLVVDKFDHAFVLRDTPSNRDIAATLGKSYSKIILTSYQPTCENLVAEFAHTIAGALPPHAELYGVKLYETASSFAEWLSSDNQAGER